MEFESKLLPVLREGVTIIKMILFKELKAHLAEIYPDEADVYINRLSGTVINTIFGTPNIEEPFARFASENEARIERALNSIANDFKELRIPLTDAIRIQFLCDSQEGIHSEHILQAAKSTGILMVEREVPLPKTFMNLVRRLGTAYHIVTPSTNESDC